MRLNDSASLVHLIDRFSDSDIYNIDLTLPAYFNDLNFIANLMNTLLRQRDKFADFSIFIDNMGKSANISIIYLHEIWLTGDCNTAIYGD